MDVSIVVITRNEERNIRRTLESIRSIRTNYKYEIILVDSNSTDKTVDIARRELGCEKVFILDENFPKNAATGRYFGSLHAAGDYIVFLDGDMEIDPYWVDISINYLKKHNGVAVVTGLMKETRTDKNGNILEITDRKITIDRFGGSFVISKSDLFATGNFDINLFVHEEVDLYYRILALGKKTKTLQTYMCNHHTLHPFSIAEISRRCRNHYYNNYVIFIKKYLQQGKYEIIVKEFGLYIFFGLFQLTTFLLIFFGSSTYRLFSILSWLFFIFYKLKRHKTIKAVIFNILNWQFVIIGMILGCTQKYNPKIWRFN